MSSVPEQLLMCLSILLKTRYCGINCILAFPRDEIRKSKTPILVGPTPSCLWDTNLRRSVCTGKSAGKGNGRESDRHADWVKEGRSQGRQGKERKWDVSHAISSMNTFQSVCSTQRFLGLSRSPQIMFFPSFSPTASTTIAFERYSSASEILFLQKKAFGS